MCVCVCVCVREREEKERGCCLNPWRPNLNTLFWPSTSHVNMFKEKFSCDLCCYGGWGKAGRWHASFTFTFVLCGPSVASIDLYKS